MPLIDGVWVSKDKLAHELERRATVVPADVPATVPATVPVKLKRRSKAEIAAAQKASEDALAAEEARLIAAAEAAELEADEGNDSDAEAEAAELVSVDDLPSLDDLGE